MKFMIALILTVLLTGPVLAAPETSSAAGAPPAPLPDARYHADILLVAAHPDDETAVSGFLARCVFDRHQRVAVVFTTHGDGGGNAVGSEAAAALAQVREIEVRRALAAWGIDNVWFLGGKDTASQNVLRSLEASNHGQELADLVRLVRLTRPQVILTWLPAYLVGENHGDHQAAGVLATEAFDMAGNPTAFPEQVAAPRDRGWIGNLTEGLRPWQPQKLYFYSDTTHPETLKGLGPAYATTDMSPSKGVPYYKLSAEEWKYHLTQDDVSGVVFKAEKTGDWSALTVPEQLIFGKSLVGGGATDDVFAGLAANAPGLAAHGYQPGGIKGPTIPSPWYPSTRQDGAGVGIALGGPWGFYQQFWPAHGLGVPTPLATPEAEADLTEPLMVSLIISNDTDQDRIVELVRQLPPGWREVSPGFRTIPVRAHESYPLQVLLRAPASDVKQWRKIRFEARATGPDASIELRVFVVSKPDVPQELPNPTQ